MNMLDSNCLRSTLYARNPAPVASKDRLDAVYKAQHVGKRGRFSAQNLDALALIRQESVDFISSYPTIRTFYIY